MFFFSNSKKDRYKSTLCLTQEEKQKVTANVKAKAINSIQWEQLDEVASR
jgi:hypothetical protein